MGLINIFKPQITFHESAPLINLSSIHNFSGKLRIEPRTAGSGSKDANHCAMLPPLGQSLDLWGGPGVAQGCEGSIRTIALLDVQALGKIAGYYSCGLGDLY